MKIVVTGGAGYIGSHFTKYALDLGHEVTVIDNLSTGYEDAVDTRANFHKVDIKNTAKLLEIFKDEFDAVVHFAANSLVGESVSKPLKYYDNNVEGSRSLVEAIVKSNVKTLVFSSTAAVYGMPNVDLITEDLDEKPINPYGETKLAIEKMMHWASEAYDLNFIALRYFNVAGSHPDGTLGERHNPETHLLPLILQVPQGKREFISIFGDDYNTEDGTCIRDYIHIMDLVEAHMLSLDYLVTNKQNEIINLGTATGTSVLEMIEKARKVTEHPIPSKIGERRAGDPDILVANYSKAEKLLGWKPKNTGDIVKDAWNYFKNKV